MSLPKALTQSYRERQNFDPPDAQQRPRPAELARRLGTTPQAVNRLTNLRHASKIDGIASAMKALGKTLEIRAA